MIQIEESKLDKVSEYAEKMLKYGGKMMSCLEEMSEEAGMGHRGGYDSRYDGMGMRGRYNTRGGYGMRESEEWDDEEYGERRGRRRDSMGRYR